MSYTASLYKIVSSNAEVFKTFGNFEAMYEGSALKALNLMNPDHLESGSPLHDETFETHPLLIMDYSGSYIPPDILHKPLPCETMAHKYCRLISAPKPISSSGNRVIPKQKISFPTSSLGAILNSLKNYIVDSDWEEFDLRLSLEPLRDFISRRECMELNINIPTQHTLLTFTFKNDDDKQTLIPTLHNFIKEGLKHNFVCASSVCDTFLELLRDFLVDDPQTTLPLLPRLPTKQVLSLIETIVKHSKRTIYEKEQIVLRTLIAQLSDTEQLKILDDYSPKHTSFFPPPINESQHLLIPHHIIPKLFAPKTIANYLETPYTPVHPELRELSLNEATAPTFDKLFMWTACGIRQNAWPKLEKLGLFHSPSQLSNQQFEILLDMIEHHCITNDIQSFSLDVSFIEDNNLSANWSKEDHYLIYTPGSEV